MKISFFNLWRLVDREWGSIPVVEFRLTWLNDGEIKGVALLFCLMGLALLVRIGRKPGRNYVD